MDEIIKKIVITFIVVCCLLSFMEISCLAGELTNYGKGWNSLPEIEKISFLTGLRHGLLESWSTFLSYIGSYTIEKGITTEREREIYLDIIKYLKKYGESLSLNYDFSTEAISKVMTDLYKDSANTYISTANMYFLAIRKLKGENIEPLLQEARKKALQN